MHAISISRIIYMRYMLTISSFIKALVDELKAYAKEAIWYQTDESIDWTCD